MNISANESLFQTVEQIGQETYRVCFAAPPHIVSDGLWRGNKINGRSPMKSSLPVFELQVLVIFAVTQVCHFLLKGLKVPRFFPQMMAGLILGPSLKLESLDKYKKMLFPYGSQDTLASISSIGYAFFLFTTAVQMDLSMITRTGHKAWAIAIIGLITPLCICLTSAFYFVPYISDAIGSQVVDVPAVVLSHTILSFAVIVSLLNELKILNSELGRLALSSVLVSDVISTSVASLSTALMMHSPGHPEETLVNTFSLIAMVTLIPLVCRPAMFWVIEHTPEGRPVKDGYIYIIIGMVLGFGWLSVQINQEFILGPFILGLAVPEGPPLGSALVKKLHFFSICFFLPIFVTSSAMKADLSLEYTSKSIVVIGFFVIFTHLVKIIACTVPALFCNIPIKDALTLALILNTKGIVEVGMYNGLYDQKVIGGQTYGMLIISVMIIACIVKWTVQLLYDPSRKYAGYQRRNLMSLKADSGLRILACIHKQYHISAITDVLDLCCPTPEHHIIVDALHLIELVGRSSPIFINHRHQKLNMGSQKSYSDDVILAFHLYEHDNPGAASAYTYTAISPPSFMHEDVCQLALDKVASIIILPFHQRWSIDGGIESDDKNIRSLNWRVLERAPCSVGIFVSRSSLQNNSSIRLAMVFLGGKDDREALCLAKRAIRDPRIKLVVYHLVHNDCIQDLEDLVDNEVLEDVKHGHSSLGRVSYQEITSKDGTETSAFLRDIVNEHDFFIVGRRHGVESPQTEGLTHWSEFSELGPIGDLLASHDFESRASVLVVQQQVQGS